MTKRNEMIYDDISDEDANDLFFIDNDDKSMSNNDSRDSSGEYMTEQAHNNDIDAVCSIQEKSSRYLKSIYTELLRVIKPLERADSYKQDSSKAGGKNRTHDPDSVLVNNISSVTMSPQASTLEDELDDDLILRENHWALNRQTSHGKKQGKQSVVADMRHILGFLNQSEWILSLNIGNIMQITPIQLEDLVALRRNEQELDRFAFLETVSFLCVGYFCVSTEIRFIIQLKEEISSFNDFNVTKKTDESEFWHTKSLEVACCFLPSDCPLLNHILLSYQKHHAPSQSSIPENVNTNEYLRMVKPVAGIENCRFRPIVRTISHVSVNMDPLPIKPAKIVVQKMLRDI